MVIPGKPSARLSHHLKLITGHRLLRFSILKEASHAPAEWQNRFWIGMHAHMDEILPLLHGGEEYLHTFAAFAGIAQYVVKHATGASRLRLVLLSKKLYKQDEKLY
jgi:hypothetical protein